MTGDALTVVQGVEANALARKSGVPRLRPGERPVAIDIALTAAEVRTLRRRAHAVGLGADAFVAVLVEYSSLCELVGADRVAEVAAAFEERPDVLDRVVASEFRPWHRAVTGRSTPADDDLPTVFLPLRLSAMLPPAGRPDSILRALAADGPAVRDAMALEAAATARGFVMQSCVLSSLLGAVSGGATPAL